ncbi:MAG: methyltransferase domain-containing protein [Sphingomonadales bacterium]|nr:methyltransferase domain-containing protein [Sphingomonadales bacterium]
MNQPAPLAIFAPARRSAQRRRALALQAKPGAATYLAEDMADDVIERLGFLRYQPENALLIGFAPGLAHRLAALGCRVTEAEPGAGFDQELPFPEGGYDLIVSLGTLHNANDLPGALIHIRHALAPGGLALAGFIGAGSLPALREAMQSADGDRPAPRLHPAVDVRAGGQLLQRAGWANPVVDSRSLSVRFSSLQSLVADLRAQGLSNCLTHAGPPLTRAQRAIADHAFGTSRVETFEILTLTGWRR